MSMSPLFAPQIVHSLGARSLLSEFWVLRTECGIKYQGGISQQREGPRQRDSGPLLRPGEGVAEPLDFIRRVGRLGRSGAEGGRDEEEGLCLLGLPLS